MYLYTTYSLFQPVQLPVHPASMRIDIAVHGKNAASVRQMQSICCSTAKSPVANANSFTCFCEITGGGLASFEVSSFVCSVLASLPWFY